MVVPVLNPNAAPSVTSVRVGYFDIGANRGLGFELSPIQLSGNEAINISSLTTESLANIDILFVTNGDNSGYSSGYVSNLAIIESAVRSGLILVIHDRYVSGASNILPGGENITFVRSLGTQIELLNDLHPVGSGPVGLVTDASLDNGDSSSHGYATVTSLPSGADLVLGSANNAEIVSFGYTYANGYVFYSTIPLDYYLDSAGSLAANMKTYAANLINWLEKKSSPSASTLFEGAPNPSGVTVASLVVDGSITDADGTAVEAIAIEALDTSLGTWQYSLDAGTTWLTVRSDLLNNTTNTLGLLLGPTDKIRLLPYGDLNGSVTNAITFRAWDMSTGTAGSYVVTTPGAGAFSTASDTADITVTAVNDAPTFSPAQGGGSAIIPVSTTAGNDTGRGVVLQSDC